MSHSPKRRSGEQVSNPAGYLATQDLRERGWTMPLIARFLGEHDLTRPNGIRMGRRRLPPVKLYLESRVEQAENDEEFLILAQQAQDRREKAAQRRAQKLSERAEQFVEFARAYQPAPPPLAIRKGATRQARAPHLPGLEQKLQDLSEQLQLSAAEQKVLRRLLTLQLDTALSRIYPWFPDPAQATNRPSTAHQEAQPADWQQWEWD